MAKYLIFNNDLSTGKRNNPGTPEAVAASAGVAPAQARNTASSPTRNLWHLTPWVARPLRGKDESVVTLRLPGSVPGKAAVVPEMVTRAPGTCGETRPKYAT